MRRTPVTVVILAWNAWETTRACLESLRPTLGPKDQVVLVDNGSTDATPRALRSYGWVDVVTNDENHGFAGGCNDGAAAATRELLVFLNNDTLPLGRWLDTLVAPLCEDPTVGAVGPSSNFVSGQQIAEGASYTDRAGMRRFAREWSQLHRGELVEVDRLVGFCLAMRRGDFEKVGGFDAGYGIGGFEDDDLCVRLLQGGYRLLIARDSFVHHEGHRTFDANGLDWFAEQQSNRTRFEQRVLQNADDREFPLVSACLITKDEAGNIGACLESLAGFADEVVVHDTGSTDDTVRIAREMGAKVSEGGWDDDFSLARNAALAHCTGEWIAWLDADETMQCDDTSALRDLLRSTAVEVDGYSVAIDNLIGSGVEAGFVHRACRLFRRARCEWTGRLHEQVAGRGDHRPIRQVKLEDARIRHTGYLDTQMAAKGKIDRNLRMAQAEVDEGESWDAGFSLTSLGRSYLTGARYAEAFENCARAVELTDNRITLRMAMATCAEALVGLGRSDEALEWIDKLKKISPEDATCRVLESRIRLARAEHQVALELLEQIDDGAGDDTFEHSASSLASWRAQALAGLDRYGEAADALLETMGQQGVLDTHLAVLLEYMRLAGKPLSELASRIPPEKATVFLAQVLQLPDEQADSCLEACITSMSQANAVLAAAASLAKRLPLHRALVWSARLRAAGHADACPLLGLSRSAESPIERARAAVTAGAAFGDDWAKPAFDGALSAADDEQRQVIVAEAQLLWPQALADVQSHPAATTTTSLIPGGVKVAAAPGPSDAGARGTSDAGGRGTSDAGGRGTSDAGAPRVSIVIPCFNGAEHTLRCLQSLSEHTRGTAYEVMLVDNASTDATRELSGLEDERFRVVRNQENTGFGPACNQGATLARGELLLFLNNDTVLRPGWLEPLVAAMDEDPLLGAVQPKLVYPDGRLNDAGGLVFGGGEPWVYGKGSTDPDAPLFSNRRAPDYASGACLLVRRSAFEAVGGFDDRYAPAYFEDTDLSFALREAGWKVLYEPASVIVHVEGATAGTDLTKGLKRFQARNATVFAEKWGSELASRPALSRTGVDEWAHRPQGGFGPGERFEVTGPNAREHAKGVAATAKSILVIDPHMPVFDRAAGSLRMFHLLRTLRECGHAVTFYAAGGGDRRYAEAIGRFGVACYGGDPALAPVGSPYANVFFPPIERLLMERKFDVVIATPWDLAEKVADMVRRSAPSSTFVIDTCDVSFVRLERAAGVSGERTDRMRALDVRRRELAAYARADRLVFVTEEDREAVARELSGVESMVLPVVHEATDRGPGFSERNGCLFVGNFMHPPNGDAIGWWRDEIGPRLSGRDPQIGLTVVGYDPNQVAAAFAGPGITAVGAVASTLPHLHRARVSVAPLRYGAGMKGKIIEALAAGVPVVTTSVGVEGTGLADGEHVLVADDPESFAAAVERLHRDPELWAALSDSGYSHVTEHFGLDRMRLGVTELISPVPVNRRHLTPIG